MFLIRLKNILKYNFFTFLLIIFTFFYVNYVVKNNIFKSKYNLNSNHFKGYIKKVNIKKDKVIYYIDDLILNDYDMDNIYEVGDYVDVFGKIKEPTNNTIFNLFNYKYYLYSNDIHYVVTINNIKKIKSKKVSFILNIKKIIYKYISSFKSKNYMYAFILGDNNYISDSLKKSYQINGISHLFAVSGMHISILSGLLLFLLSKFISIKKSYICTLIFLIFYLFVTGFSKSIIRAFFLFFLLTISIVFNIKINKKKVFIIFTLLMLIINPYNIYNSSFLFSYIICFYLLLCSKFLSNLHGYFNKLFIVSSICFFSSIPITININYEINIISIFLNLLFVPLVSIIIFPLCLFVFMFKKLEFIFLIFIKILEQLSLNLNNNKIIINIPHINYFFFIIYYIVFTFTLYKIFFKKYIYIFLHILLIICYANINCFDNSYKIIYLDVKQGDSSLILYPHNSKSILIDTGGVYDNDIINENTISYLKSLGIKKLNYLVLTHGDYDHMGEAMYLVNNFKVEKVIFNCGEINELETDLIKVLDKKKIPYYSCIKELNVDNNKLYFLQTKEYDNENDNSNVIYTEIDGYKFMFMGDAGIEKEKDILNKYNISDIDVLKVGHHGSRTSSSKEFIDEINPKYSIISVGKNNRYGHPNKEVLNNLDNSKIYRTDKDGSIMFKIKNNKLNIEICSP